MMSMCVNVEVERENKKSMVGEGKAEANKKALVTRLDYTLMIISTRRRCKVCNYIKNVEREQHK